MQWLNKLPIDIIRTEALSNGGSILTTFALEFCKLQWIAVYLLWAIENLPMYRTLFIRKRRELVYALGG
ncbi:MAG TPA: hypothetical protein VEA59_02710, partial [Patescibacteria group bacterium]|nr:hypothetical protein [Patescibacteria group bacterium]